ncbi:MAG: hypothetical protein R3208_09070 [Ketobacteraceae bacterium]|nr:hypothetical protein [Ketobacteraceae bacterium]
MVSLWNVGVSDPYRYNGVFNALKAVVHPYNTKTWLVPLILKPVSRGSLLKLITPKTPRSLVIGVTDNEEDGILACLMILTDPRFGELNQHSCLVFIISSFDCLLVNIVKTLKFLYS